MIKRKGYISKLKKILKKNKVENIDEIIEDINELFSAKISEGKSENSIITELGTPESVAKQYIDKNKQKPMGNLSKVIKFSFIGICSVFTILFTLAAIFAGIGEIDVTGASVYDRDIEKNVYVLSSQTDFKNDYITVTLKNVSKNDFEDQILHLEYLDNGGDSVGDAYSEQKVVTIASNSTKTISFRNPGWMYSEYYEIVVCVRDIYNVSSWGTLKNGREFVEIINDRQRVNKENTYFVICEGVLAFISFTIDIILITNVVLQKKKKCL